MYLFNFQQYQENILYAYVYIHHFLNENENIKNDKFVFFNVSDDCEDLSCIGLHGKLSEQFPEFVESIPLQNNILYHFFALYNNECGIHIFSIKGTLDEESEKFWANEAQ